MRSAFVSGCLRRGAFFLDDFAKCVCVWMPEARCVCVWTPEARCVCVLMPEARCVLC